MAPHPKLTQQHGYVHAGVLTSIEDSARGYSALSLAPEGDNVLTVEFKVNFLRPASADRFEARAKVIKPWRLLSVCQSDVVAIEQGAPVSIVLMQCTMMIVANTESSST